MLLNSVLFLSRLFIFMKYSVAKMSVATELISGHYKTQYFSGKFFFFELIAFTKCLENNNESSQKYFHIRKKMRGNEMANRKHGNILLWSISAPFIDQQPTDELMFRLTKIDKCKIMNFGIRFSLNCLYANISLRIGLKKNFVTFSNKIGI